MYRLIETDISLCYQALNHNLAFKQMNKGEKDVSRFFLRIHIKSNMKPFFLVNFFGARNKIY